MSQQQLPYSSLDPQLTRLLQAVNQLILGNSNNSGSVTLTENTTTTTVLNSRVGANSKIILTATTANAAAALATTYVSAKTAGQFTITHANNAQTDRKFDYIHVG